MKLKQGLRSLFCLLLLMSYADLGTSQGVVQDRYDPNLTIRSNSDIKFQVTSAEFDSLLGQKVYLFINGNYYESLLAYDRNRFDLAFYFELQPGIMKSFYGPFTTSSEIKFSIGNLAGFRSEPIIADVNYLEFTKPFWVRLILATITLILLIYMLVFLNRKKTGTILKQLMKDISRAEKRPYSLSRSQLLWWTLIIAFVYLGLFVVTGQIKVLSGTAVILLGISLGVTATGRLIDESDLMDDKVRGRHQDENYEFFWIDIMSDREGISVHRFQNVVFNIVFGLIFIYYAIVSLEMPEFSTEQLALIGISGSAYAGIKINENRVRPGKFSQVEADERPKSEVVAG